MFVLYNFFFVIYIKHREECFIGFPTTKKCIEKTRCSQNFLTNFEVFGNKMKHSFGCLLKLLKPYFLEKFKAKNHGYRSDFLCLLLINTSLITYFVNLPSFASLYTSLNS